MTVTSSFNEQSSNDVNATRAIFGQRLGEIITGIIGDDRIQKLFDDAGKHPDEYKDKPTGLIAMDLGVITPDTKTALLVAQAAERAYALAEKAAEVAENRKATIGQYRKGKKTFQSDSIEGTVSYDDAVFKFVGSERDPAALKTAQSTWFAAQIYLNTEIIAIRDAVNEPDFLGGTLSMGVEYAAGLKQAAAQLYGDAATMMAKEGHDDAAAKLTTVAAALSKTFDADVAVKHMPAALLQTHLWNEGWACQQANIGAGGNYHSVNEDYRARLSQIASLLPQPPKAPVIRYTNG